MSSQHGRYYTKYLCIKPNLWSIRLVTKLLYVKIPGLFYFFFMLHSFCKSTSTHVTTTYFLWIVRHNFKQSYAIKDCSTHWCMYRSCRSVRCHTTRWFGGLEWILAPGFETVDFQKRRRRKMVQKSDDNGWPTIGWLINKNKFERKKF